MSGYAGDGDHWVVWHVVHSIVLGRPFAHIRFQVPGEGQRNEIRRFRWGQEAAAEAHARQRCIEVMSEDSPC